VRAVYYIESPYQHNQVHHRAIYRIAETGTEQVVAEAPGKEGTHVIIGAVRASPNELYLAYVVDSKKQAFLAGPRNELFIRDLATGREKKIAKYGYMGNLIWSPDGKRLYFAGGEYSSDSAVRVVDVAATFSR
jgi:protease II